MFEILQSCGFTLEFIFSHCDGYSYLFNTLVLRNLFVLSVAYSLFFKRWLNVLTAPPHPSNLSIFTCWVCILVRILMLLCTSEYSTSLSMDDVSAIGYRFRTTTENVYPLLSKENVWTFYCLNLLKIFSFHTNFKSLSYTTRSLKCHTTYNVTTETRFVIDRNVVVGVLKPVLRNPSTIAKFQLGKEFGNRTRPRKETVIANSEGIRCGTSRTRDIRRRTGRSDLHNRLRPLPPPALASQSAGFAWSRQLQSSSR